MALPAKKSRFGGSERLISVSSIKENKNRGNSYVNEELKPSSSGQLPVIPSSRNFKISKN